MTILLRAALRHRAGRPACRRLWRQWLALAALTAAVTACDGDFTYTTYPCRLVIDNSIHQNTTLASAMTPTSPGVFCLVQADERNKKYVFTNNQGQTSSAAYTAIDMRLTRSLGMNNALIVGYGSLTGEFYAYDRECPVCFDPDAVPQRSKPLSPGSDGNATCTVCKRVFSMNTGGNCISEGGVKSMTRYRGSSTGPFGTLSVSN